MNKRNVGKLMVAGLALLLAGCGTQQASQSSKSSSSSSLLTSKTSDKISADNLSPQQAVSLIATYAGNKYGDDWATMTKKAEKNGLTVNLYPTSKYKLSDNGQGVAYDVTAGGKSTGLVYTVNNDDVNLYENVKSGKNNKKIATISKQDMASYVNDKGQAKLVSDLAKNAQVVDKRSDSSTSSANDGDTNSGQYGNRGKVNVPAEMQGTWYSQTDEGMDSVTFGPHTVTMGDSDDNDSPNSGTFHIYKQDPAFLSSDQTNDNSIQDATMHWVSGKFMHLHGLDYLNTRGWCQTAGDGTFYAVHTETINGKQEKVLVVGGGAGLWTEGVYYQSKDMAQQQGNKKYDDLYYMDDDD